MKLSDASMVVVEQTEKVSNTFVFRELFKIIYLPTKNIFHSFIFQCEYSGCPGHHTLHPGSGLLAAETSGGIMLTGNKHDTTDQDNIEHNMKT